MELEFLSENAFKENPKPRVRAMADKQVRKNTWYLSNSTTKILEGRPDPELLVDWKGMKAPNFHNTVAKIIENYNSGNLKDFWNGV